jgi:hypothetical protein
MTILFQNQKEVQYNAETAFDDILIRESRKVHTDMVKKSRRNDSDAILNEIRGIVEKEW